MDLVKDMSRRESNAVVDEIVNTITEIKLNINNSVIEKLLKVFHFFL